jgi:hypothetical protein
MKIKRFVFCSLLLSLSVGFSNCSHQTRKAFSGNYSFTIECLGVEHDGTQTLRTWGKGRNKADAIEQARKNAVHTVLFKGIRDGQEDCYVKPVIGEVNAEMKYKEYFNRFFADNGEYLNFISNKDEPLLQKISRDSYTGTDYQIYGLVVRVLLPDLEQKMITDGILK